MEITTYYSSQLFGTYCLFNTVYKNGKYYWTNLFPAAMLLCAVYALRIQENGLAILAVAMGVLSPLLIRHLVRLLIKVQLRTYENLNGQRLYSLRITQEGFTIDQKQTQVVRWSQLWRVYHLQGVYYFYSDARHAYLVPTGDLDERQRECLKRWLEEGVPPGRLRERTRLMPGIQRWARSI